MFEKWLTEKEVAEKGLKDKVTSRLNIIKQGHSLIASVANHTLGYVLSLKNSKIFLRLTEKFLYSSCECIVISLLFCHLLWHQALEISLPKAIFYAHLFSAQG